MPAGGAPVGSVGGCFQVAHRLAVYSKLNQIWHVGMGKIKGLRPRRKCCLDSVTDRPAKLLEFLHSLIHHQPPLISQQGLVAFLFKYPLTLQLHLTISSFILRPVGLKMLVCRALVKLVTVGGSSVSFQLEGVPLNK